MTTRHGLLVVAAAAAALGCAGPETVPVTVTVRAPDREGEVVPIPGAELTLLPFDIDSLYASLEEKNQAGPEPTTESLEPLYQAFYEADTALIGTDSLIAARQRALEQITDRASPQYREAFAAYQRAEARRESLSVAHDSAEAVYDSVRNEYNRKRATWEASAWDRFGETSEELYSRVNPPRDSAGEEIGFKHRTGEDGAFKIHVPPGRWWIAGRVPVPRSPHEVYRWNVGITVAEEPLTVQLTGENATKVYTY